MRLGISFALAWCVAGCGSVGDDGGPGNGGGDFSGPDAGIPGEDDGGVATTGGMVGNLGAIPFDGGVGFRVWAPGADQVFLAGDFNQWSDAGAQMQPTDGGVFALDVEGAAPGQAYEYLVHHAGQVLRRQDPRARAVESPLGPSLIVDPSYAWTANAWQPPPADERVVYELHLGTFNPPAGTVAGTFATAAAKLDYLADLGVNMIEVMPPIEFPTTTSWGYNPDFPYAIQSSYGAPDDARAFVDAAHARGIGVLIDVVHNHWAGRDQPMDCFDGVCNEAAGDKGIYFYSDKTRATTPWGPRPDFGRAEVADYIRENALMWLAEYRCDGMRWDSVSNIRGINNGATANPDGQKMLVDIMNTLHAQFPSALQIAEDLATIDYITQATTAGGLGFDSQWDGAFYGPLDQTVITATDGDRSMTSIQGAITHKYNGQGLQRIVMSEDHDIVANGNSRIPEMISPGNAGNLAARQRSTVAAAIVMTSPGVPMIFMGQEFLENGHFSDTIPLDWTKTNTYSGILQEYKDLIALRRDSTGTSAGLTGDNINVYHVNDTAKVIAYHRWKNAGVGDDVVVLANFSNKPFTGYIIGLPRAGVWHTRFSSDSSVYSPDYANTPTPDLTTTATARDGYAQQATVQLGAYQVIILSQ